MKDFEEIPHTADIKIRVYGKSFKEILRNAVVAMFQVIQPKIKGATIVDGRVICKKLPHEQLVEIDSVDKQSLLVDFLSEALYLSDLYNQAYLDAVIEECSFNHVKAKLLGVDVQGFEVVEIKAVTYHELSIKETSDGWHADIVFDI